MYEFLFESWLIALAVTTVARAVGKEWAQGEVVASATAWSLALFATFLVVSVALVSNAVSKFDTALEHSADGVIRRRTLERLLKLWTSSGPEWLIRIKASLMVFGATTASFGAFGCGHRKTGVLMLLSLLWLSGLRNLLRERIAQARKVLQEPAIH